MGNRAIITLEDQHGVTHPVALYVHWHGGLESVLAFTQYTWDVFARGRGDVFTYHARLCQVIGNFFCDGCSLYGHPLADVDSVASGCDNGRFHVCISPQGVTVIGRESEIDAAKQHEYWTREHNLFASLKAAMPKKDADFTAQGGTAPAGVEAVS